MFVLLWIMLSTGGEFEHYHIASFTTIEACKEALKESKVLVTNANNKVVCLHIKK
jgi:hypothetical protein